MGRSGVWLLAWLGAASCDGAKQSGTGGDTGAGGDTGTTGDGVGLDPDDFVAAGLAAEITTVSCTLSGGTQTTCYQIEIAGVPADHDIGPFCPRSIEDGPEVSGIWIDGGEVYDADGAFIEGLADFYGDDAWQLYDEQTGEVNVTDTQASCEAAARPDVDPAYQNYCVECDISYVDDPGMTFLIPVTPVPLASAAEIAFMGSVGVALSGAHFDPPAPTEAILGSYTIAAFDDCGGHVNLATGYHYHGATGCTAEIAQGDGHGPRIGYALDGYGMYAMVDEDGSEPGDLDACRGHTDAARGYHYHVAGPGENLFIGCFHGEQGEAR